MQEPKMKTIDCTPSIRGTMTGHEEMPIGLIMSPGLAKALVSILSESRDPLSVLYRDCLEKAINLKDRLG